MTLNNSIDYINNTMKEHGYKKNDKQWYGIQYHNLDDAYNRYSRKKQMHMHIVMTA